MTNQSMRLKLNRDQCNSDEELGEREETPRRMSNVPSPPDLPLKSKLLQESGACIQEKLAYDELLRYQRSRSEDMVKLYDLTDECKDDQTQEKERDDFRRAAGFREEWRIGMVINIIDTNSNFNSSLIGIALALDLSIRSRGRNPGQTEG